MLLKRQLQSPVRSDDLIFDIGMNACEDTAFYLEKGFRVVAVEANPSTCNDARKRFESAIAKGQLTIVNRAISPSRDPLRFYLCTTNSAWSTALPRLRDQKMAAGALYEEIVVPTVTPVDLVREHGIPHYAKIDIEGFDLFCLDAFRSSPVRPAFLSLEVDFYRADELLSNLLDLGYRKFALVGQMEVPRQRAPFPAREGFYCASPFEIGSSGLFGRELAEEWIGDAEIRTRFRSIIRQYRLAGLVRGLARTETMKSYSDRMQRRYLPLACNWYDIHGALD